MSKESGKRQTVGLFFSSPPQCLINLLLYKCMFCFFICGKKSMLCSLSYGFGKFKVLPLEVQMNQLVNTAVTIDTDV